VVTDDGPQTGGDAMLIWRVLSAVVGIPLVVAAVVVGGPVLLLFVLILALLAAHEFITKCRAAGINVPGVIVYPVVFVAPTLAFAWTEPPLLPVLQGAITLSGGEMALALLATMLYLGIGSLLFGIVRYHRDQSIQVVRDVGATALRGLYIAIPWSFVVLVRTFPYVGAAAEGALRLETGAKLLLFVFLVTWATDVTAYFVGRSVGKRKLTPVSPNKTFEGAVGGLVGAIAAGMCAGVVLGLPLSFTWAAAPLLGVMGQMGDLAKSILKRDLGTKDFGSLIPGHGGSLDRFDSLMVNAPIAFFCALAVFGG